MPRKGRNYFFLFLSTTPFQQISFLENNFLVSKEKHNANFLTIAKFVRISFNQHPLKNGTFKVLLVPENKPLTFNATRSLGGSLESVHSWTEALTTTYDKMRIPEDECFKESDDTILKCATLWNRIGNVNQKSNFFDLWRMTLIIGGNNSWRKWQTAT